MAWSNKAERAKITAEKSHSLAFAVRVEDRLHKNMIQTTDKCLLTVRPAKYLVGFSDTDITVGTASVMGNGVRADASQSGTGEEKVFLFEVQAAALNLNPETEYSYDITYVRNGYSMALISGEFDVVENPTNRAISDNFVNVGGTWTTVATLRGGNVLNVSSSMPMPTQGVPGTGAYTVARALAGAVGSSVVIPVSEIVAPQGRTVQVGDVLFSSVTIGVLASVQSISTTGTPSATVTTRQVYGRETLKALLDTVLHIVPTTGPTIEVIDSVWTCPKTQVPLPSGYEYRIGDMLFSHSALGPGTMTKKLLISLVEGVSGANLTVRTKIVFPMFLDADDIAEMMQDFVLKSRTINGRPLTSDLMLTEDDILTGTVNRKYTLNEYTKLSELPTNNSLQSALAGKANNTHSHAIQDVLLLQQTLNNKIESNTIQNIWVGTQAAYNALGTKYDYILYIIKG